MKKLILMRGLPGSGKSDLAQTLRYYYDSRSVVTAVYSTDDYFIVGQGKYEFKPDKIAEAHLWNQTRAMEFMRDCFTNVGVVIIDNTNIKLYEMKPYVFRAVQFGFKVSVAYPQTPWAFDPAECHRRCTHGVPLHTIEGMRDRFDPLPYGPVIDVTLITDSIAPWEK